MRKLIHTITDEDVGKPNIVKVCECCGHRQVHYISGVLGRVLPIDVGKRVFLVDGVLQVENNEQRDARLAKEAQS